MTQLREDAKLMGYAMWHGKCKAHPKYKGSRRPKVLCAGCWELYCYNLCEVNEVQDEWTGDINDNA